ncbi:hypothetical protein B0H16DRAFT_1541770 [Mycena metata]|uniref:Uncharacterized protein n=1 Tax=Mycena metata TaxID=1033252 RepID=A0AAD7NBG6_9AGAR|nr:hypothetical protein B0H16DRAFT_1541770 [Mycena metata]
MFNQTVDEDKCTLWIRASTRRLCVDDMMLNDAIMGRHFSYLASVYHWKPGREDIDRMSYNGPNHEAVVISSLALSDYHKFCGSYSSHSRSFSFPAHATATIGMVVKHHSNCEVHPLNCAVKLPVNIAFLPLLDVRLGDTSSGWGSGCSWGSGSSCSGAGEPDGAPSNPWIDVDLAGDLMPDSWRRYGVQTPSNLRGRFNQGFNTPLYVFQMCRALA